MSYEARQLLAQAAELQRHSARLRGQLAARFHQSVVDSEVRASRKQLRERARERAGSDVAVLFDPEFLAIADAVGFVHATLAAALTAADACDLQFLDRGTLHIGGHHGFAQDFLDFFAAVDAETLTACGRALATGEPVLIEDIAESRFFTERAIRETLLDAGSLAVASYPLRTPGGEILGVLSFHHTRPRPLGDSRERLIAHGASGVLARLPKQAFVAPAVSRPGTSPP
ncbi:GAF domain-containing protein [Amycolatopsis sp. NPDC004378]